MCVRRLATRVFRCSVLVGLVLGASHAVRAEQVIDLQLHQADGPLTRAVFDFGVPTRVDTFTPAQTGLVSASAFQPTLGLQTMRAFNPTISMHALWDGAAMSLLAGNGNIAAYLGGSSLSLTLPGGVGAGPLTLSNAQAGFKMAGVVNNARAITAEDVLFVPGGLDAVLLGMDGPFSGAGLQVTGAQTGPARVNLLADPMFSASYNGAGSLADLDQLIVRVQPANGRTLAAAEFALVDRGGTALSSVQPPMVLNLTDFAPATVSLRFSGDAGLTLDRADYASDANFAAATSFWSASGFQGVGVEEYVRWAAAPIPEPGSLTLLVAGLAVVLAAAAMAKGRRR